MSCPVDQQSLERLRQFLTVVKNQPEILNLPQLDFFREFIESFGGKVPPAKMSEQPKPEQATEEPDEAFEEEDPESELELDMDGCVEPDKLDDSQEMGDSSKQEIPEEDSDKADEKRREAMSQFSEGNFEKCIELYTEAIELNPQSALLFAKRGQAYLKLTKPNACIKDCTRALELNPDSAAAYKFRGRAYRLLGEFELAAKDLRQACNIDFDEQTDEWLKEVTPNAKKIEEHELRKERRKKEKEEKERKERLRRAKEAHEKASKQESTSPAGGMPFEGAGMPGRGGMPGGAGMPGAAGMPPMGDFYKLLQDPEIMTALQDPEVATAFEDISKNPANIIKYQSNPKITALLGKLSGKFSGSGMSFPGFGGASPFGSTGGAGGNPPPTGGANNFDLD